MGGFARLGVVATGLWALFVLAIFVFLRADVAPGGGVIFAAAAVAGGALIFALFASIGWALDGFRR